LNFIKPDWYMQKIKSTDESVYNLYLKELYKRFVLYDGIASEYLPIYITRHEIKFHKQNETKRKQASGRGRKKIETVETSAGELSVDKFKGYCEINLWDILDYVPPNSGIEEGEQDEFMRELFGEIFKFDDEREIYKINLTYNTMKKLFNTLKKRRQSNPCAYDGIAKNLANLFSYETGRMISQDIILELFYPPPYEC
jgi:hypothetical protein